MRRLVILPLLLAAGLLAGCSQVTQAAGDALGIPVEETCTNLDSAYDRYQLLLAEADATEEQLASGRADLVATLDDIAAKVDGQLGDLIRSGAQQIGGMADLQSPETIEAVEQAKDAITAFCG